MDVDVVVIGGGPVGLSAAIGLGELGVSVALYERRATTSYHPRGHVVTGRTMEIFRGWGVADEVESAALPYDRNCGSAFCLTLAGPMLGSIVSRGHDAARDAELDSHGPQPKVSCPQDELEPVLRRKAESLPTVAVHFGTTVEGIHDDGHGVDLRITHDDQTQDTVRASYVIAADGARSQARDWLGIRMEGDEQIGTQMGIYFHADLWEHVAERPYLLWWVYNVETSGVLIALDGRTRWTYNFAYDPALDTPESFTPERCREIVRSAVGDSSLVVDVKAVGAWQMQARTAERFRSGRVFLAGDAAHPLPPTGGQGMNTGIGDIHNLAWKLAHVLNGDADQQLLDTYDQERRPVAKYNVEQSRRNAEAMVEAGLGGIVQNDDAMIAALPTLNAQGREQLQERIEMQRDHFDSPGQVYGATYESSIILDDGSEPSPFHIQHYSPSSRPGSRAPHAWADEHRERSIIDFFTGLHFTLVTTPNGAVTWRSLLAEMGENVVKTVEVGRGGDIEQPDRNVIELYGLESDGAVLVRPDGYVAWRAATSAMATGTSADISQALGRARLPR